MKRWRNRTPWRTFPARLLLLLIPLQLYPVRTVAQSTSVTTTEEADQISIRPMACPLKMTGGFLGYFFGYEHAGHEWTDSWQRDRIRDPENYSLAEYVPLGDPYYIESRDGEARWYEPRILVRCTITEVWSRGHIIASRASYKVVANGGNVVECGSGGGTGGTELMPATEPYSPEYDPYMSSDSYAGDGGACGGDSEAGTDGSTGTSTGSGTQYQPGDSTGGETVDWGTGTGNGGTSACGDKAIVEYACIDIWVDGVGWQEWGCGYVTTC